MSLVFLSSSALGSVLLFFLVPRLDDWPGMRAMTEGWLKSECGNCETTILGFAAAIDLTVSKTQVAAAVPLVDL